MLVHVAKMYLKLIFKSSRCVPFRANSDIPDFYVVSASDGRFGSKVGQIGPKWDKSGAFSDQISVHLAQGR